MVAPESIAALFGSNLSTQIQLAATVPLPTTIAGASLFIRDNQGREHLAPLFFASPTQINFQVPPGLPPGSATVYAVNNGNIHSTGAVEIANVSPGLFAADASGKGLPAALVLRVRANGEQVYEPVAEFNTATNRFAAIPVDVSNPAEQVFLILFGTGFRNRSALSAVAATVGGANAAVEFAGAQGALVGVDQANLRLPSSLAGRGEVEVVLTVEGKASNTVRVVIR